MVRKSIKMTLENKKLNMPILISRIVIYGISLLLFILTTKVLLGKVLDISKDSIHQFVDNLRRIVFDFMSNGIDSIARDDAEITQNIEVFKNSFVVMLDVFKANSIYIIGIFAIYFLLREVGNFFLGMVDYTVGKCIESHMDSLKHLNFLTVMLDNFKQALGYGLYRFVMTFTYNFIATCLGVFLTYILIAPLKVFILAFVIFYIVLTISLRQALVGQVLPYMIKENISAFRALGRCFKKLPKHRFFRLFVTYFSMDIIAYAACFTLSFVTFGVALLIIIPIFVLLFISVRFIDYYTRNQIKYYNSYDDIVIPKSQRQNDENLLNKVDI